MVSELWTIHDYHQYISFPKEFFVLLIYILLITFFAIRFKKKVKNPLHKKYVFPAISLKVIGSISITSIYIFYYKSGDTTAYFNDACALVDLSLTDFTLWKEIAFNSYEDYSREARQVTRYLRFASGPEEFMLSKIGSIFAYFTFKTFYPTALLFSWLSFLGLWKLFETFVDVFPHAYKEAAYATFFIPSVFFWGSGFMKESLILFALGNFVKALHFIFIRKKYSYIFSLILGAYLIINTKLYILLSLAPALLIYLFFSFKNNIKSPMIRFWVTPILMMIMIGLGLGLIQSIGSLSERYSVDNILETAQITGEYIKFVSDRSGGSSYDLGDIDYTSPISILKVFPKAVNVTLYRPYPWEIKNVVMIMSALESLIFWGLSIFMLFKLGPIRIVKHSTKNPFLYFCLIFSIIFSFAVGFTSFNFGTLVRYKIPMMPFFGFLLLFLYRKKYLIPQPRRR